MDKNMKYFLDKYLQARPIFLSLVRAKEATLYQKYLPFKGRILDFGCGDGFFAKTVLGKKADVGLDMPSSRINDARKLDAYKKITVYDGQKIPYTDGSFNAVISNCVLEHIPDIKTSLSEISRVLKKGGIFITTVNSSHWEEYLFGKLLLGSFYQKWLRKKQEHHQLLHHKKWDELFKRSGFKIIEKTGILDRSAVRWVDILQYLSISSLVSYKLSGKWVLFRKSYPLDFLAKLTEKDVDFNVSASLFYVLVKK